MFKVNPELAKFGDLLLVFREHILRLNLFFCNKNDLFINHMFSGEVRGLEIAHQK